MKTEKIMLSFIAVLVGLLVAGVVFYFYRSTKVISPVMTKKTTAKSSPTPKPTKTLGNSISLDQPQDGSVIAQKSVVVSGKTAPDATVIISTSIADQTVKPSANGNFSTTIAIDTGTNLVYVTAILANGSEITKTVTVTYNTESF